MARIPPVSAIADGVWRIDEFGGTNCYLVAGTDKALLIDCGTGVSDMRAAVRSVTALPLVVAATHGHADHIGGAGQFAKVYVHEDDCRLLNRLQMTALVRKVFVRAGKSLASNGITPKDVELYETKPRLVPFRSFRLDLGGKTIEAVHTPGHSAGSVLFVDDADGIVFSGDNVCDALWMHLPGGTSIEAWLPGARTLYALSETHRVFWGHRTPELTREYIGTVIRWGEELLEKTGRNSLLPRTAQYPPREDGIVYKTNRVYGRK